MTTPMITFTIPDGRSGFLFGNTEWSIKAPVPKSTLMEWLDTTRSYLCSSVHVFRKAIESIHVDSIVSLKQVEEMYDKWNNKAHGWRLIQFLKESKIPLIRTPDLVKLLTMEILVDPHRTGKNPAYQCLKVRYTNSYIGLLNPSKPKLLQSLQAWFKTHTGTDAPEVLLKKILQDIIGHVELDIKILRGDDPSAPEVFTKVWTKYSNGGASPSVSGSCMRHEPDDTQGQCDCDDEECDCERYYYDDAVAEAGIHPAVVYCTSDISLAWCEDSQGLTTMRALLNNVTKRVSRYYGSTAGDRRVAEEETFFRHLQELGYTKGGSLLGCHLKAVRIGHKQLLAPYLDGHSGVRYDGESLVVSRQGNTSFGSTSACAYVVFRCSSCSKEFTSRGFFHRNSESRYCALCAESRGIDTTKELEAILE